MTSEDLVTSEDLEAKRDQEVEAQRIYTLNVLENRYRLLLKNELRMPVILILFLLWLLSMIHH